MLPLRPALLFLLLPLLLGWPWTVTATGPETGQQQLEILRQHLAAQETELKTTEQKTQTLRADLAQLDQKLEQQRRELAGLNRHLAQLWQQQAQQQQELQQLKAERDRSGKNVQRRLAAAHRTGEVGLLNILFAAESLPELLALQDYFLLVREYDREVIARHRQQISHREQAQQHLTLLEAELLTGKEASKHRQEQLRAGREERTALLRRLQNQEYLHQQARQQIAAAVNQLTAIPASRDALPDEPSPSGTKDFTGERGSMTWPAEGDLITEFGQTVTGRLGTLSESRGITIQTGGQTGGQTTGQPPGQTAGNAPVRAVAPGTVVYASRMEGYGQLVIIEHQQGYFSLLAGLDEIDIRPGEAVRQGQTVGAMASGEPPPAGRLYLEIRHGVEPLDPLVWLPEQR